MKKSKRKFSWLVILVSLLIGVCYLWSIVCKSNGINISNRRGVEFNKVPYISTYYFNPKPSINEDIKIPFYITDYNQSEYLENNLDLRLDLEYEIDGKKYRKKNIKAGDSEINLGKLSEGEHYFSLQAIDRDTGLRSHKLYNEILVVNPESYKITEKQTYKISDDDLVNYKISKDNSTNREDLKNTREGLTNLFKDLQGKGYRKCILPNGTYRIDDGGRNNCISIPTNFTVDMNGSTFKLDTILEKTSETSIVRMYNTYDSHLINGTLEGDRFERKDLGLEVSGYGEPINTFYITGGKYSSVENLTVKNTTGHALMTVPYSIASAGRFESFSKGIVIDGKELESDEWVTSNLKDISKLVDTGYLVVGTEGGYRGVKGESLVVYMNFYDENEEFIETIVGYQYRKTKIPKEAKYLRVSFLGEIDSGSNISAFNRELGTNWSYKNIEFLDTRTTAIATTSCNNLLIEGCTFTRSGNSITPVPVDFEDGWQECQDVYFRNNTLLETAFEGSGAVIDNSGYNHVYENNDNFTYTIRQSVVGVVIREHKNLRRIRWERGYQTGSAYGRMYNNIITETFTSKTDDNDLKIVQGLLRDSTIKGSLETSKNTFIIDNSILENFSGGGVRVVNSEIDPKPYIGGDAIFESCNFYNMIDKKEEIRLSFNTFDTYREFTDCNFLSPTKLDAHNQFNSGIFKNCVFEEDVVIKTNGANELGDIQFNNCTFKGKVTIEITDENGYIEFNECIFKEEKVFNKYGKINSNFN